MQNGFGDLLMTSVSLKNLLKPICAQIYIIMQQEPGGGEFTEISRTYIINRLSPDYYSNLNFKYFILTIAAIRCHISMVVFHFTIEELTYPYSEEYNGLYKRINPNLEPLISTKYIKYILQSFISDDDIETIFTFLFSTVLNYLHKRNVYLLLKVLGIIRSGYELSYENLTQSFHAPKLPNMSDRLEDLEIFTITDQEKMEYESFFYKLKPKDGLVSGAALKPFLQQTKLPNEILRSIWTCVDVDDDGFITKNELDVLMKLVNTSINGVPLPHILPPCLLSMISLGPKVSSKQSQINANTSNSRTQVLQTKIQISDYFKFPDNHIPTKEQIDLIERLKEILEYHQKVNFQISEQLTINEELTKEVEDLTKQLLNSKSKLNNLRKEEDEINIQLKTIENSDI